MIVRELEKALGGRMLCNLRDCFEIYVEFRKTVRNTYCIEAVNLKHELALNPDGKPLALTQVQENEIEAGEYQTRRYKIVRCTDYEGNDRLDYNHRIGREVSAPILTEESNIWLRYLKEKDGTDMNSCMGLSTSLVDTVEFISSDKIKIMTLNSIIYLDEVTE